MKKSEEVKNPYEYFENTYPYIDTSDLNTQQKQSLDSILVVLQEMDNINV